MPVEARILWPGREISYQLLLGPEVSSHDRGGILWLMNDAFKKSDGK